MVQVSYHVLACLCFGLIHAFPEKPTVRGALTARSTWAAALHPQPPGISDPKKMLLWYNRPHRDDMSWYPKENRGLLGWAEIAAVADALTINAPEFLPRAVFGAPPTAFSPQNVTHLNSSVQDSIDAASSALDATSPRIHFDDPAKHQATVDVTLFPLSVEPWTVSVRFEVTQDNIATSQVVWPWVLMNAYMRPDVQKRLSNLPDPDPTLVKIDQYGSYPPKLEKIRAAQAALHLLTGLRTNVTDVHVSKYSENLPVGFGIGSRPPGQILPSDLKKTSCQWTDPGGNEWAEEWHCDDGTDNTSDVNEEPYFVPQRPAIICSQDGSLRALQGPFQLDDGKPTKLSLLDPRAQISSDKSVNYHQNTKDPEAVDVDLDERANLVMSNSEPMAVVMLADGEMLHLVDRKLREGLPINFGVA